MIVRGEHDGIASEEDLLDFFRQLPNPDRQFVVLPVPRTPSSSATTAISCGTS
jgi:hypothetical protein